MKVLRFLVATTVFGLGITSTTDIEAGEVSLDGDADISNAVARRPTTVSCTGRKFDLEDHEVALNKTHLWCGDNVLPRASAQLFTYRSALWAVCNCHKAKKTSCPLDEMDEALALVNEQCGPDYSGQVWSRKSKKVYIRDRVNEMETTAPV
ncbi:hypothetical protein F5Y19DRAFT_479647 [Xylariaceae sp. FL1651]|nr:hypothetical protein F5Y19DRAFT_479647 [Xylariaceae sp. FL1651]